jgi:hypothetical protein
VSVSDDRPAPPPPLLTRAELHALGDAVRAGATLEQAARLLGIPAARLRLYVSRGRNGRRSPFYEAVRGVVVDARRERELATDRELDRLRARLAPGRR